MNKLLESFHKKILNSNAIEKITEEEMEEFLELKDKAIPKKVITSIPNLEYECPNCMETDGINPMLEYCHWCGQKLNF